jgi:hypothetical protein
MPHDLRIDAMTHTLLHSEGRVAARLFRRAAPVLLAIAAGCGTKEINDPGTAPEARGRVRFVNVITDTTRGRVDLALERVPWNVNQVYTNVTPATLAAPNTGLYSAILTGARTLTVVRTASPSTTVATVNLTIAENADYTVYGIGGAGASAVTGFITRDTNVVPAAGQARVRVVHLAPTAGAVDIFVTAPAADLALATPTLANVPYQAVSGYLSVAAGTYQVRVVPAGTAPAARAGAVAINVASLVLGAQVNRTIVAADNNVGGAPLRAFVLTDR